MRRVMWVERKTKGGGLVGPAHIGWVEASKSGKSLRYRGQLFLSLKGSGFKSYYISEETGDEYWISGCRKDGCDALYSTKAVIDEDAAKEYWGTIRKLPENEHLLQIVVKGRNK